MISKIPGLMQPKPCGFAKRMITFEGSTQLPLKFVDLTSQTGTKQAFSETSRKMTPNYKPVPNVIINSTNIPPKIIQDLKYLSKPPISPHADDCCGSGCEDNCVFIIYYNEFKHWKKKRREFLDFLLKEENQNIINEKEYDSMLNYLGLDSEGKSTSDANQLTWPKTLKPGQWESPPLVKRGTHELLSKEDIVERDIEQRVPLDILQFDRLEQKLQEKREQRAFQSSA